MSEQTEVTPEMLAKLPKWAQKHIKDLDRRQFVAIRVLNEFQDKQTPGPMFYEQYVSTGEEQGPTNKRCYIQSNRLKIEWCGVNLEIGLYKEDSSHWPCIELTWGDEQLIGNQVAMIPISYQRVGLVAQHNMRVRPVNPKGCEHDLVDAKHCLKCGWRYQL